MNWFPLLIENLIRVLPVIFALPAISALPLLTPIYGTAGFALPSKMGRWRTLLPGRCGRQQSPSLRRRGTPKGLQPGNHHATTSNPPKNHHDATKCYQKTGHFGSISKLRVATNSEDDAIRALKNEEENVQNATKCYQWPGGETLRCC